VIARGTASALIALLASIASPAGAATYRVDDSASIPHESSATLQWRHIAPSRGGDNTVEGATVVQVRLSLAPWIGRNGRVFLVLPEQSLGQVRVTWTTQGRLLPGRLISGERVLVYAGPVTTPFIDETLALKIETDGTRLSSSHRLNFHFEIDID
jgi:hypothetical protein